MSASWVTFVFEAANFLVLAALLGRLFFRPVRDALERRRAELEGEREAARRVREEAEAALAEARRPELIAGADEQPGPEYDGAEEELRRPPHALTIALRRTTRRWAPKWRRSA